MAIDKIFNNSNIDDLADNVLSEVDDFMLSVEKMQKRKVAGNVQLVIQSLRKIENDLRDEYGDVANKLSERIAEIKNGQDGRNGADGRAGKDGRAGRDGLAGSKGADGLPGRDGIDGVDGVSVMDASIDFDGSLIISLSNGRVINVGEVVSQDLADKIQVISTMSTNGAVGIQDEGTSISTGVKNINFVGASVTSTASGDNVTVNIGAAGTGVFDAGTALLPSITTTGDLNTGVYFPAADTVGITTGGAQRGAFSSTGLSVTGTVSATNATIDGGAVSSLTIFRLGAAQSGNLISMRDATGTELLSVNASITTLTTPSISIRSGSILNYLGTGYIRGAGNLKIHDNHSGNIEMAVGGGVVLIGSATPVSGAKLEVTGTLSTTGVATFAAGTAALPSITTSGDTNTGVYFPAADTVGITTGGAQRGEFSSTGLAVTGALSATTNIGVGTTAPSIVAPYNSVVDIRGTTTDQNWGGSIRLASNNGTTTNSYFSVSTAGLYIYNTIAHPIIFGTNNTERMRIDSSGNLLLGLASALTNGKLQVAGSIGLSGNTEIRQATNGDGNTLKLLATHVVVGVSNSTSYSYAGTGLLASVSPGDGTLLLDAGFATSTLGRFKVTNLVSPDVKITLEKNGVYTLYADTGTGSLGIGAAANASAILDAQSTTKGVRMPNMTTTQKNAIATPAAGLMVYDTTLAKLCVYTTAWETITSL